MSTAKMHKKGDVISDLYLTNGQPLVGVCSENQVREEEIIVARQLYISCRTPKGIRYRKHLGVRDKKDYFGEKTTA